MCDLLSSWACSTRICCTYHLYCLSPLRPLLILIFHSAGDDSKERLLKLVSNAALQNVFYPSRLEHPTSTEFEFSSKCKELRFRIEFIYVNLFNFFMTMVIYLIESATTKQLGGNGEGLNASFGMP